MKTSTLLVLLFACIGANAIDSPASYDVYAVASPKPDTRGTAEQPLVISKPVAEQAREASEQWAHANNELAITIATITLAFFTIALWVANVRLIGATKRAAAQQAEDTQKAIREQTRAADAMQGMVEATKGNAALMQGLLHKQMRPYITVDAGSALYQDATLRFEAQPTMTNNGLTPARNVCFKILADIVDGSSLANPPTFAPIGDLNKNDVSLAPRQSYTIRYPLPNRVPEDEVEAIMKGNKRRLFAWGKVTYDDVFGGSWETNFCLSYWFAKMEDGWKPNGNFHHEHNNAT